jgi:hypothetical protein
MTHNQFKTAQYNISNNLFFTVDNCINTLIEIVSLIDIVSFNKNQMKGPDENF